MTNPPTFDHLEKNVWHDNIATNENECNKVYVTDDDVYKIYIDPICPGLFKLGLLKARITLEDEAMPPFVGNIWAIFRMYKTEANAMKALIRYTSK